MLPFRLYRSPVVVRNCQSELLLWEEAMDYVYNHSDFILAVKAFWGNADRPQYYLDLTHVWDVGSSKTKAKEFLSNHLGKADYFQIEH